MKKKIGKKKSKQKEKENKTEIEEERYRKKNGYVDKWINGV